jgi:hypothetical protein
VYRILISNPVDEEAPVKLETDSKGEARAIASVCNKCKVECLVTRTTKEVEVKYNFTPAVKK